MRTDQDPFRNAEYQIVRAGGTFAGFRGVHLFSYVFHMCSCSESLGRGLGTIAVLSQLSYGSRDSPVLFRFYSGLPDASQSYRLPPSPKKAIT